jgi:DNA gyrase subunit A
MNIGAIRQVNIGQEMRDAYLDYAMSVIVARALPDARDGLKPVHRRILYAMYDMGIRADSPYKKSARIVGEVLGKYHPHSDDAVYETMVRLAQDFSMRYVLVDGQGNFGSIDGDNAAAMRYTEARMAQIGEELLVDIGKETVDFTENFDGSLMEPSVLPAAIPNLLVNGSSGIAVGMSTNVPPHNLGEVCDALVYMLENWKAMDDIAVEDLMRFVKGPDFPTGGLVYRHSDVQEEDEDTLVTAYATGRGKITVRAKLHTENMGRGKSRIIVSELPYQTNKSALIERIATLVQEGRLEGIADLRDESDRQGLRLVIELQRGAEPSEVLSRLFQLTPLQETFSIITLALVNGEPRLLSLKQCLRVYLEHRLEVIRRRSEYDLARARERAHILEGLLKALDKLDETIAIIRRSRNVETARDNLRKELKISEIQAQAILDMQLRRLAALERKKIEDEYAERVKLIKYLEGLLQSPQMMREVIADELKVIKDAYGDPRRTIIVDSTASAAVTTIDLLMPEESTWVTFTVQGKLGRTRENTRPSVTAEVKEPPLTEEDEVTAIFSLPSGLETGYLFLATARAEVKRLRLEDLPGMSSRVFSIMDVEQGDRLGWSFYTRGEDQILLTTAQAQAIRFDESDVRPTGLAAGGMRGIKLAGPSDRVIGAHVVVEGEYTWNITDDGVAKISPIADYPTQGRAGGGVIAMRLPKTSSELVAATIGRLDDNIIVLTSKNKPLYMRLNRAPHIIRGRPGGDFIISLRENERVARVVNYQTRISTPDPATSNGNVNEGDE